MSFSLCNKKTLRETWKHSLLLLLLPHPYIHPGFLLHFTHSLICHITRIFMVGSVSSSCLEVLMRPGFNLFVMPSNHHHHHHHELVHLARLVHPIRSSHPSLQDLLLFTTKTNVMLKTRFKLLTTARLDTTSAGSQ